MPCRDAASPSPMPSSEFFSTSLTKREKQFTSNDAGFVPSSRSAPLFHTSSCHSASLLIGHLSSHNSLCTACPNVFISGSIGVKGWVDGSICFCCSWYLPCQLYPLVIIMILRMFNVYVWRSIIIEWKQRSQPKTLRAIFKDVYIHI